MKSKSVRVRVPFFDVDMMQIVWHGHYVKYFELARCALLEDIGYSYLQMLESGYGWPVVDLHVRYARPAKFDVELEVTAELLEWEYRLKIGYQIHAVSTGEQLTRGTSIQVAVRLSDQSTCFMSPPILFEKLGLPTP